jgi:peptide/nickel transport system permease protein
MDQEAFDMTLSFESDEVEGLSEKPRTYWGDVWKQLRRHRMAVLGGIILIVIILATLLGPVVYTISPKKLDFANSMALPSLEHPFGTNDMGQDLLARVLTGGRISITVGLISMLVGILLGSAIGAVSGFFGGTLVDMLLMRLTDLFLSMPQLPLLLLIVFLFRSSLTSVFGPEVGVFVMTVLVIGGLNWMPVARLVRASFLSAREMDYVKASRALGASQWRLVFRGIFPNVMGPVIVAATLGVGTAIITESMLSFLGLGFPPDTPTWGRMLFDSQNFLDLAPGMAIFPGLMIFLTVFSVNSLGDGLRDALDPQQRDR